MTLNASGPISLGGSTVGQSINLELGQLASTTITMNDTNARTLAGVPSGQISLSDFYGKSSSTLTIGLISYWELESGGLANASIWTDSTGANNLTLAAAPAQGANPAIVAGKVGNTLSIGTCGTSGTTGYLVKGSPINGMPNTTTAGFTIGGWFKKSVGTGSPMIQGLPLVNVGGSPGANLHLLIQIGNDHSVQAQSGSMTVPAFITPVDLHLTSGNFNVWIFFCYTISTAGTPTITVSNLSQTGLISNTGGSGVGSATVTAWTNLLFFNNDIRSTSAHTDRAQLDQLFMYNRQITGAEMLALWNGGAGRSYASL